MPYFCRNPLILTDFYAIQTPIVWHKSRGIFFANMGGGGGQNYFQRRLFCQGKTPEFTKMGEIHELFVLALSLVWFAGAAPDMTLNYAACVFFCSLCSSHRG